MSYFPNPLFKKFQMLLVKQKTLQDMFTRVSGKEIDYDVDDNDKKHNLNSLNLPPLWKHFAGKQNGLDSCNFSTLQGTG